MASNWNYQNVPYTPAAKKPLYTAEGPYSQNGLQGQGGNDDAS